MKKIITVFTFLVFASVCFGQSKIVGRVDADGNTLLTASKQECSDKISAASSKKSSKSLTVSEVSFTQMPMGQFCLTGYEKDKSGKIISGARIECTMDDERNLIITPASKVETVTGRAFAAPAAPANN